MIGVVWQTPRWSTLREDTLFKSSTTSALLQIVSRLSACLLVVHECLTDMRSSNLFSPCLRECIHFIVQNSGALVTLKDETSFRVDCVILNLSNGGVVIYEICACSRVETSQRCTSRCTFYWNFIDHQSFAVVDL